MGQPAGTFDTYDDPAIREDLSDAIYLISPTDCPFMAAIGRGDAENVYHEWQTDSLAAPDGNNAVIEGDDATLDSSNATSRIGNRCQILDKTCVITGTEEEVRKAGRKSQIAYQLAKKGKELKRDLETIITGNQASVTGSSAAARKLGSLESWLTTNVDRGATGASGGFSSGNTVAATDGTQRAITESLLKGVIQKVWTAGGDGNLIMVGPKNKQAISAFAPSGNFYRYVDSKDKRYVTAVDVYVSDFGTHRIVPNRFSRDRTCFVLSPEYWSLDYLRGFRQHELAKTGDSEKRQMLCEVTLRSSNEAASGVLADLTTP